MQIHLFQFAGHGQRLLTDGEIIGQFPGGERDRNINRHARFSGKINRALRRDACAFVGGARLLDGHDVFLQFDFRAQFVQLRPKEVNAGQFRRGRDFQIRRRAAQRSGDALDLAGKFGQRRIVRKVRNERRRLFHQRLQVV